jgi:putative sporulation protein YtaF
MVLFAFAVSLDGFGAGVAYGMRRIKIPWFSLVIICLASSLAISLSMFFGYLTGSLFAPVWANRIASLILVIMGCWIILQAWKSRAIRRALAEGKDSSASYTEDNKEAEKIIIVSIKSLGIVIQILREPERADLDDSGTINAKEAAILGFALAMDALGAGFGAAMTGFTPFLTPVVVGICKFFLVSSGLYLGAHKINGRLGEKAAFLPGVVLILLGIL